ncbi:MAG: sodium-translocating pyrophosphatase, partial [Planctomycetes bacterium]|nr:sodium-translocating pyrophosphatase [Planctomycetota bacterium]
MKTRFNRSLTALTAIALPALLAAPALAGEADLKLPNVNEVTFASGLTGKALMMGGLVVAILGSLFGLVQYKQTVSLPAHRSMLSVSNIIWETCKSYVIQQGKYLSLLWILI